MNPTQLKALREALFAKAAAAAKAGNADADRAYTDAAEMLLDAQVAAINARHAEMEEARAFLEARRPGTPLHQLVHGTFGSPAHH